MVKRGDMLSSDDILDILGIKLIGIVPDDEGIISSSNKGEPSVLDSKSKAGEAYRNITARILGEEVPLMDLEDENKILVSLKKLFGRK